jgi:hypothetical protein
VAARLTVVLASLALIAAVAGCGGGGSSSTVEVNSGAPPEGPEIEKEVFIAEADALCSDYQAKVGPIKTELEKLESVAEPESPANEKKLGEALGEAIDEAEIELESLRELEPPSTDAATIEKMLGTAEQGNALGTEAAEALEAGDTSRFSELATQVQATNNRAKGIAEGYGLKVCGQSST